MEQNKDLTAIKEKITQCQKEQTKVTVFLLHHQFTGVVIRMDTDSLEMRLGDEKALIRLRDISAIFYK